MEEKILVEENSSSEENIAEINETKNQPTKRGWIYYIQATILLVMFFGIYQFGYQKGRDATISAQSPVALENVVFKNKEKGADKAIDFSLFWNVWDLLRQKYVDTGKLDAKKLFYGAIKGMMQATGDPYTTFFDPEENKKFGEDISGNFEGIGAELGIKGGVLTVIAPLPGTPAEKAGLRSGDKIIKIDGKNAADMNIEEAVNHIRGAKETSVVLTIFREGESDTKDITIQRNVITVKSVTLEFKENDIADIKLTKFGDDTVQGFVEAINKVKQQNSKGLVIDLRNNPGGYLNAAVDIASKLLPQNNVVVIEESGDKSQKKMYTRGGDVASQLETVVLINEGSASASEILAGALRDNRKNVILMGKKSFGKGSVQEFVETAQGTAAKITVARWLTPNGEQINEVGIKPEKEINLTNDDFEKNKDPQLEAAITYLKDKLTIK
jgi:carboxyl-terminal processing protease